MGMTRGERGRFLADSLRDAILEITNTLGDRWMTLYDIRQQTGLSHSSAYRALYQMGAEVNKEQQPYLYALPKGITPENVIEKTILKKATLIRNDRGTPSVVVALHNYDNVIQRWEMSKERIIMSLGNMMIGPEMSPKQLSETFASAATVLSSVAWALRKVENDPDWFAQLGGHYED